MEQNKIAPTITLAQLYEAQHLYFDAIAIYRKLYEINPTQDITDRIESLQSKLFSDENLIYNMITQQVFSREELAYFKIIPADKYELFTQSEAIDTQKEIELIEEDFEENEFDMTDAEDVEEPFSFDDETTEEIAPTDNIEIVEQVGTDNSIVEKLVELKETRILSEPQSTLRTYSNCTTKPFSFDTFRYAKDIRVSELFGFLMTLLGKDKTIGEISVTEILDIINFLEQKSS